MTAVPALDRDYHRFAGRVAPHMPQLGDHLAADDGERLPGDDVLRWA